MKDTLVSYKGGGYDGCFWEWNYFLWNGEGKFENLFASGYKGIVTEEVAKNLKEGDKDVWFTDLNGSADDVVEFVDSTNASHVKMLHMLLCDRYTLIGTCQGEECEMLLDVEDLWAGDWGSDGGISYNASSLYCEHCHAGEGYDDIQG